MCRRFPDLFLLTAGKPNGGLILLYLKVRNPILAPPWVYDGEESQRLKWYGYTEARQTRQNLTRQSKTNKWLVLSGFLHQMFAGNLKEVGQLGQIMPDSTRLCLLCKQREIRVLPDTIWSASLKMPTNFWSRKIDRTSNFLVLLCLGRLSPYMYSIRPV